MEQQRELLKKQPKKGSAVADDNAQQLLIDTIIDAILEKKGEDVVSIDLRGVDGSFADYFIICEATNFIQLKTIANYISRQTLQELGEKAYRYHESEDWILLDFVDIVVHIFKADERRFYDLEGLWMDGISKEHKSE